MLIISTMILMCFVIAFSFVGASVALFTFGAPLAIPVLILDLLNRIPEIISQFTGFLG